jgi:aquaporin Z
MTSLLSTPSSDDVKTSTFPAHTKNAAPHQGAASGLLARLAAEAVGTLILVVVGLGVPIFSIPQSNPLPASLASGLAVTAAMLAFAYVSGGHFNPAVTVGNLLAGRLRPAEAAAYVGAQLAGALIGSLSLFALLRSLSKLPDTGVVFDSVAAGFGDHSYVGASVPGVLLVEVLGVALLVAVYLSSTADRNPAKAAAPFAVGLTFAVLLQFGQAVGNVPFNPARATASAIFGDGWPVEQLWLFWVAPLVGAAITGLVFRGFTWSPSGGSVQNASHAAADPDPDLASDTEDDGDEDDVTGSGTDADQRNGQGADVKRAGVENQERLDDARQFFERKSEK